jgi:hypothetical protein
MNIENLNLGDSQQIPLKFIGGTEYARYTKQTTEATYNMMISGQDVNELALVPYLGYQSVLDINSGEARQIFYSSINNSFFGVFGDHLIKLSNSFGYNIVGSLKTTRGQVYISENQANQLAIVDGANLYVYNYSTGSFQIVTLDFHPIYVTYQDTFLILTGDDFNWHISDSNDALTYNPLARNTMQSEADVIQAAIAVGRQLWIIGKKTTDLWFNQGQPIFPYVRSNSVSVRYGCVNRATIAQGFIGDQGFIAWLAQNENYTPKIVFTAGNNVQSVSTEGLDFILSNLIAPQDSYAFMFSEDAHIIYQIVFPTDNYSIAYDFTAQKLYNVTDHCFGAHIAKKAILFNGQLYFISINDSKIYKFGTEITTAQGEIIPRVRICPSYRLPDGKRFKVRNISLVMEQGESDLPSKIELRVSNDGGYQFGNGYASSLRPIGYRKNRMVFSHLGSSNDFTPQFRLWSKYRFVITNAAMEVTR